MKKLVLTLLAITAIFALCLWPGDFLRWDDRVNLAFNPLLTSFHLGAFWTQPYYGLYIPVTYSLWTLLYRVSSNPMLFHAFNLILHLGNALLVYILARKFLSKTQAAFAAVIFFAHPLQMEAVGWISGGRDLLAAFFALGAAVLWLSFDSWLSAASSVALFALSLLSKPSAAALPAALVLLGSSKLTQRRKISVSAMFAGALGFAWYTGRIQSTDLSLRIGEIPWLQRLWICGDSLGFYVAKFIWPYPLSADYGRTPAVATEQYLYVLIFAVAVTAIITLRRYLNPRLLLASTVLLLPTLGLVPFQAQADNTVADRYVYLAMFPLAIAAASLLQRRSLIYFGYVLAFVYFSLSALQLHYWRDNRAFFGHILEYNPKSTLALTSMGVEEAIAGHGELAERYLEEANRLQPKKATIVSNLAQVYWFDGKAEKILSDLYPLASDPEFLHANETEQRGVSAFYIQIARAMWKTRNYSGANDFYCRFHAMDPENEIGRVELDAFFKTAKANGFTAHPCEKGL